MTATSTINPSPPSVLTRSWTQAQRIVALVFVIAAFVAIAFVAGRASAPVHHGSTTIVSTPSVSAATLCRVGPC